MYRRYDHGLLPEASPESPDRRTMYAAQYDMQAKYVGVCQTDLLCPALFLKLCSMISDSVLSCNPVQVIQWSCWPLPAYSLYTVQEAQQKPK